MRSWRMLNTFFNWLSSPQTGAFTSFQSLCCWTEDSFPTGLQSESGAGKGAFIVDNILHFSRTKKRLTPEAESQPQLPCHEDIGMASPSAHAGAGWKKPSSVRLSSKDQVEDATFFIVPSPTWIWGSVPSGCCFWLSPGEACISPVHSHHLVVWIINWQTDHSLSGCGANPNLLLLQILLLALLHLVFLQLLLLKLQGVLAGTAAALTRESQYLRSSSL